MKESGGPSFEISKASSEVLSCVRAVKTPVILVEGTGNLPDKDKPKLVRVAEIIARVFPDAKFRTGNATGADEAFAEGLRNIGPGRTQYVLPYETHGKKKIDPQLSMVF